MPSTDHPPDGDASYGHILHYWLTILEMKDRDLAEAIGVDRTYPGQIQRGPKVPTTDVAERIRHHLLTTAQTPGRYGRPPLTESERASMDEQLRTSFARQDQARRANRPGSARHEDRESMSAANAGSVSAIVMASPPTVDRRSIHPVVAVCLIALALALPFVGVIYYVTHASAGGSPRAATLSPEQLRRMVINARPVLTDALIAAGANGWDEGPVTGDGGCAYVAGAYHATVLRRAVVTCLPATAPPLPASGTVAVQVDLTFLGGDGGGGLVLCYAGSAPYYRFVVRKDGYFDLFDPVTGVQSSAPGVTPSARYRLTAIIRAGSIYLYIDGVYLAQAPLEPGVSVEGAVGIFAVDGPHNPTDVAFHDFTVWAM